MEDQTADIVNILEPNELLTPEKIRNQIMRSDDIGSLQTNLEVIQWLVRRRLLLNRCHCAACEIPMSFVKHKSAIDGFRWQCRLCKARVIKIVYWWSREATKTDIAHECNLGDQADQASNTTDEWVSFCREICYQDLLVNPPIIGGFDENGQSKIVEIDESKFADRTFDHSRVVESHSAFGGIERGSGKCFLLEVPNKRAETLMPIIKKHILPGTIIVSASWIANQGIGQMENGIYDHRVVLDKDHFVDSKNPDVHIQNIRNMWMRAKEKLRRQGGTYETQFRSYLPEFNWRNQHRGSNIFAEFIIAVQRLYPV